MMHTWFFTVSCACVATVYVVRGLFVTLHFGNSPEVASQNSIPLNKIRAKTCSQKKIFLYNLLSLLAQAWVNIEV